ncbi:MAG: DNA adenine methylase [Promethearchaeota archaeon]
MLEKNLLSKQKDIYGEIITSNPKPFLKWAGGKRKLIKQMSKFFPQNFNNYIEPFVGGGAVFFYLYSKRKLNNKIVLIDNNKELINCYKVIKNNIEELIELLYHHKNEKKYYYEIRSKDRNPEIYKKMSDVEKASRTIYMNKCCYNGLYRVNSKGQFNTPFGSYKNPNFCDKDNLKAVNIALKDVDILHGSFKLCLNYANEGDFVYLDPPYFPLSDTSSFTSYTKEEFGIEKQKNLYHIFKELDKRGCKVLLSNSYSDFILNLYQDYNKITLKASRAINCNGSKRGEINEILIHNDYN